MAAVLWAVFLVGLQPGCGRRPRIAGLTSDSVIVAFGDSLTSGAGAGKGESYPAVLEKLISCKVVNAGVPGEGTDDGLARLPGVLEQHKPDLVIVCHGGNDILSRRAPEAITANLRRMIQMIRRNGSDVVLVGVLKFGVVLSPAGFYEQLARERGVPYDGEILRNILSTRSLKSDHIHPNAAGYRKMAEALARLIRNAEER
jgi:lysophospholipase L1-like esterase